ncbi:hypothetical protein HNR42_002894 [Deinobacterium chartae]|uniref:Uncharacterized protein n=1 Tax=Deinobacterium chartae TaxID=521158 RepID=A0A841I2F5_9DEIO|nr:hypothetical protein [Deinobacterium chartae]MBB6099453.1 hypothetical protein [Deinobacterium chartae]
MKPARPLTRPAPPLEVGDVFRSPDGELHRVTRTRRHGQLLTLEAESYRSGQVRKLTLNLLEGHEAGAA